MVAWNTVGVMENPEEGRQRIEAGARNNRTC